MIVFDLQCEGEGHRFEGWFASSTEFDRQRALGLVACPQCGVSEVTKAPMAPAVGRKGNQAPTPLAPTTNEPDGPATAAASRQPAMVGGAVPPPLAEVMAKLAAFQAEALKQSTWVGDTFADRSRAMHYGESAHETIHGQATADEAQALAEEGIAVLPLPFPVAPPDKLN